MGFDGSQLWMRAGWRISVLGLVLGAAAVLWWARCYYLWEDFGAVTVGQIYRAGALTPAQCEEAIERFNLRTIVALGADDESIEAVEHITQKHRLRFIRLDWPAHRPLSPEFVERVERLCAERDSQPLLLYGNSDPTVLGAVVGGLRVGQGWSRREVHDEMALYSCAPEHHPEAEALVDELFRRRRYGDSVARQVTPPVALQ